MSPTPSEVSQASTKVGSDVSEPDEQKAEALRPRLRAAAQYAYATEPRDILLFLVAFRVLNALVVRTFFQPDEYFQSLEPAWQMVFGEESGAWITWVSLCLEGLLLRDWLVWMGSLQAH